jgi:hypothetical protein
MFGYDIYNPPVTFEGFISRYVENAELCLKIKDGEPVISGVYI